MTNEKITGMLGKLLEVEDLSEWESKFTNSLQEQFEAKGTLSPKQVAKLTEVYNKRGAGKAG